jgi:hypothetical protein
MKWFTKRMRREEIPRWEPNQPEPPRRHMGRNMRVSDLEEAIKLTSEDCLLLTHESGEIRKSMKVKLSTLQKFIKS